MQVVEVTKKEILKTGHHLLYAVEMLAFAVIGWAWLAVRELMGDTPVLDVSVLLTILITSAINLPLALIYPSDQFKNSAQAFLSNTACVCFLYAYGLYQSTTDGSGAICCASGGVQSSVYSLRLTYKVAYFGGLALHQTAAAITLSFLTFFLILAVAQAKACIHENERGWPLLGKSALGVLCLISMQQAMFGLKAPVCKDKDTSIAVIFLVILAVMSMLDMHWIYGKLFDSEAVIESGIKMGQMVNVVQLSFEMLLILLIGVSTAVLAVNLGGSDAFLVIAGCILLWQMGRLVSIALDINNGTPTQSTQSIQSIQSMQSMQSMQPMQSIQSTQSTQSTLASNFLSDFNPSPPMLLPGVHELRRTKKAW